MRVSNVLLTTIIFSCVCSAQFKKGTIGIGGGVSWECSYWQNQEGTSIITIKPEANYFYCDNLSVLISINTLIYLYPDDWGGDPDVDKGFGLGGKYYFKYFYGGLSFLFKKMNLNPAREHLLFEAGRLVKLSEKVFLDVGLDYQHGISTANKKNSKIKTEIGIAVFL